MRQTDLPRAWSRNLSWKRRKINKKCNHKVGKQYKIIEGEWYYGKEEGKTSGYGGGKHWDKDPVTI